MTPIDRINNIRQCLRLMQPVMGFEVAGAEQILHQCDALERIFTVLGEYQAHLQAKGAEGGKQCG